ncbi:MAG: hypothetical protein ACTHWA_08605 [Arachnia sp.]
MAARFLVSHPCNDACCEVMTEYTVEGAPVYRCPGCDSEWIELGERTADKGSSGPPPTVTADGGNEVPKT